MKKVLFTLISALFVLIPINVNADITCKYDPQDANILDKYGEITITKKDDGTFLVNDKKFTGQETIDLNRKISNTEVYFPGGIVELEYNHTISKEATQALLDVSKKCDEYDRGECGTNIRNANGTSQFVFDCTNAIIHCNYKSNSLKAGGNYNVLSKIFTGDTCPTLNFAVEYSKDLNKMYLLVLSDKDVEKPKFSGILGRNTYIKANPIVVNKDDLVNVNYVYFSDNDNQDNYNFFSSIVYNKATGKLKFTYDKEYSNEMFDLSAGEADDSYTTYSLNKNITFNNVEYSQIQFKIYKGFKSKLDNWNQDDYVAVMFSTGELGTLTHYVVYSGDIKEFAKNTWGYTDDQAQALLTKISGKAGDVLGIGGGELKKMTVESVPFCAPTSGALKVFKIVGYVIVVLKILVPIALIIFASIDFFRAMMSSSEDAIKKATTTVMQRAVIGVIVFFIPTLVYYFVGLIGNSIKKDDSYFTNCNTCLLNPDDCPARDPYVAKDN